MANVKPNIDLAEAAKLVAALERDVAKLQSGSQDVQALRDEVDQLRRLLDTGAPDDASVGHGLQRIHRIIDNAVDTVVEDALKAAGYVTQIGRMLGM